MTVSLGVYPSIAASSKADTHRWKETHKGRRQEKECVCSARKCIGFQLQMLSGCALTHHTRTPTAQQTSGWIAHNTRGGSTCVCVCVCVCACACVCKVEGRTFCWRALCPWKRMPSPPPAWLTKRETERERECLFGLLESSCIEALSFRFTDCLDDLNIRSS